MRSSWSVPWCPKCRCAFSAFQMRDGMLLSRQAGSSWAPLGLGALGDETRGYGGVPRKERGVEGHKGHVCCRSSARSPGANVSRANVSRCQPLLEDDAMEERAKEEAPRRCSWAPSDTRRRGSCSRCWRTTRRRIRRTVAYGAPKTMGAAARVAAPTSVRACLKPSSGGTVRVGDRNRPPEASGMQQAAEKEPTDLMNEG